MWRRGFVRRWGWIPSQRCSRRRGGAGGYRGKSANFRVSDRERRLWLSFPMHKRFAIALQTVRGFAGAASGRSGPGLGNGGNPARRCGDLVFSVGSETGRRQPRFSAGTSKAPARQPRFSASTSEAPARQPRFSAGTSEAPARQPRFSAVASGRGDVTVHHFSPNAAIACRGSRSPLRGAPHAKRTFSGGTRIGSALRAKGDHAEGCVSHDSETHTSIAAFGLKSLVTVSDPPTKAEVEAILAFANAMLSALQRQP